MKPLRPFFERTLPFFVAVISSLFCFQLFMTLTSQQNNTLTPQFQQTFFSNTLQQYSTEAAFYVKPPLDQHGLQTWLEHKVNSSPTTIPLTLNPTKGVLKFIGVVNQEWMLLAADGHDAHLAQEKISSRPPLSSQEYAMLNEALHGQNSGEKTSQIEPDGTIFIAVPIAGSQGQIQGALLLQTHIVTPQHMLTSNAIISLVIVLSFFLRALPITISLCIPLYIYSCRFSHHISQLTTAVKAWSQGDFSVTVHNSRKDEIGQLTQHLNGMAQQLKQLIEVQRDLASSNERNRLARELHDTVKQRVFALSFQIAIARKLHRQEHDQLAMHLEEAQSILQDIQKEMANLIFPMRQAALENQSLADALATYLSRWSYQYGIFVKFTTEIQGQEKNFALSAPVKKAFFRVAQEALSNVARHSKASYVQVTLTIGWLYVALRIADDGEGFDYLKHKAQGIGLSSMEERINEIHGHIRFTRLHPSGTEVLVTYKSDEAGPDIAIIPTYRRDRLL